jgi:hypothetical protein
MTTEHDDDQRQESATEPRQAFAFRDPRCAPCLRTPRHHHCPLGITIVGLHPTRRYRSPLLKELANEDPGELTTWTIGIVGADLGWLTRKRAGAQAQYSLDASG